MANNLRQGRLKQQTPARRAPSPTWRRAATASLLGAVSALASATAEAAPSNSANMAPLMKAVRAIKETVRADPFAAPPALPAKEGDAFTIVLTPRSGESTGVSSSSGYWLYKEGRLQFYLSLDLVGRQRGTGELVDGFIFAAVMTPGKPYVGRNAYNASTLVKVENWTVDGIAVSSMPEGDYSPYTTQDHIDFMKSRGSEPERKDFPFAVNADGPAARAIVATTRVVVSGRIAKAPGVSGISDCWFDRGAAKIDKPWEVNVHKCWVGAEVTRIAYVNAVTGEVLREFLSTPLSGPSTSQ